MLFTKANYYYYYYFVVLVVLVIGVISSTHTLETSRQSPHSVEVTDDSMVLCHFTDNHTKCKSCASCYCQLSVLRCSVHLAIGQDLSFPKKCLKLACNRKIQEKRDTFRKFPTLRMLTVSCFLLAPRRLGQHWGDQIC